MRSFRISVNVGVVLLHLDRFGDGDRSIRKTFLVINGHCTYQTVVSFHPSPNQRASTALNMDRRAAMGAIAGAALVVAPSIASADGAISAATIQRSKFTYGSRIAALKDAVSKGDFGAVAAEKNAFILYNSGAYPRAKDKDLKSAAIAGTNAIFAAIRSKDAAALKQAYNSYVTANDIKEPAPLSPNAGQGYSSDYDYRVKTKQAAIYVR
jgi:Photosystem II Psb31 protein